MLCVRCKVRKQKPERRGLCYRCAARESSRRTTPGRKLRPDEDPTEEELNATIAVQCQNLPKWWHLCQVKMMAYEGDCSQYGTRAEPTEAEARHKNREKSRQYRAKKKQSQSVHVDRSSK